jgi:hypothetical protein
MRKLVVFLAAVLVMELAYLVSIGGVNALSNSYVNCTDGFLIKNITKEISGTEVTFIENETCPYGCSDSGIECNELASANPNFVLFPIAILIVAGIFAFLSVRTNKEWFQFLFLGLTMIFLILSMGLFAGYTTLTIVQTKTLLTYGYQATIYGAIFTLFILFLLLLFNVFKPIFEKQKVA